MTVFIFYPFLGVAISNRLRNAGLKCQNLGIGKFRRNVFFLYVSMISEKEKKLSFYVYKK